MRLVSPPDLALTTGSRVRVVVEARRGWRVRVLLDGRRLTARRARSGRLVATILRRRLKSGSHVVGATASRGGRTATDSAHVFVPGRRARLMRVDLPRRGGSPLPVRLKLVDEHTRLRAFLNGRRVDHFLAIADAEANRRVSLSAAEGLRFGRNRLTVLAYRDDGTWSRVTRTVTVRRSQLLASAGVDRVVRMGRRVRLDGLASRAARGGRLAYRWRVVRRPRGSRARIVSATSSRPMLHTDRHGRYRVRLEVVERAGGGGTAGAARSPARDTMNVYAQPPVPPIGYPINSYDTSGGAPRITIGTPGRPGYQAIPITPNAFTLVTLDPQTLEATVNTTKFDAYDANPLFDLLSAVPTGSINVLATGGGTLEANVLRLLFSEVFIGASPIPYTATGFSSTDVPRYSLIGVGVDRSNPPAQFSASQFTLPNPTATGYTPAVTGYLTKASPTTTSFTGMFTFSPSEIVPYSIDDTNGFSIGCKPTTSYCATANPTIPSPGFGVAVLDAYRLTPVASQGFAATAAGLTAMAQYIDPYSSDPTKLVMVKSQGAPAPDEAEWSNVSYQINKLDGSWNLFNTYNAPSSSGTGSNDYQFVGVQPSSPTGQSSSPPDFRDAGNPRTSAVQVGPKGRLQMSGILTRNRLWQFAPSSAGPLPVFTNTLAEVSYQPPRAFPYSDANGPYSAAEAFIARAVFCAGQGSNCTPPPDIRSQYWQQNITWSEHFPALQSLQRPAGAPFTEQQFNDLKTQLLNVEWPAVDRVSQLFGDEQLLQPFTTGVNGRILNVGQVAKQIENALPVPETETWARILETIGDSVGIIAEAAGFLALEDRAGAAPPDPSVPEQIGAWAESSADAFDLASLWVTDGAGDKLLQQIQEDADKITSETATAVTQAQTAFENIRELVVSDYGKLLAIYDFANEQMQWTNATGLPTAALNTLTVGANQLAWTTLLPAAFQASCANGIVSSPSATQWNQVTRYTAGGGSVVPTGVNWSSPAPSSLLTQVFAPLSSDGTGTSGAMTAADFWENYYVPAQVSYNQQNANPFPPPASPCNGQQLASAAR